MKFNELINDARLLRAIEECGYDEATEIQSKCIPIIEEGKDIVGQSQTGTGKTAAFGLPMLELISPSDSRRPQVLILCPTRELCIQVCDELKKFSKYMEGIRIVPIYGGTPINNQITNLKGGVEVVVGTPGRVIDHIERKTLRFNEAKMLILDEADEMLNMGFIDDINTIIEALPEDKQTILFSATMPKAILNISKTYQHDPELIKIKAQEITNNDVEQKMYDVNQGDKKELLMQLIEIYKPKSSMVFCNTKKMVDDLSVALIEQGYSAAGLHGDLKQEARSVIMRRFKDKKIKILVATDVAARGIDVDNMDVVFNYDIPQELEYYVHRIGRTGRAGNKGVAITFVTSRQHNIIAQIEKLTKSDITLQPLPSEDDLKELRKANVKKKLLKHKIKTISDDAFELLDEINKLGYEDRDLLLAFIESMLNENEMHQLSASSNSKPLKVTRKDTTRIEISIGKNQQVATAHIVSAIAEASGVDGKDIGKIRVKDDYTEVEVPVEYKDLIIESLNNTTIKGQKVIAKGLKGERPGRSNGERRGSRHTSSKGNSSHSSNHRRQRYQDPKKDEKGNYKKRKPKGNNSHSKRHSK